MADEPEGKVIRLHGTGDLHVPREMADRAVRRQEAADTALDGLLGIAATNAAQLPDVEAFMVTVHVFQQAINQSDNPDMATDLLAALCMRVNKDGRPR